MRLFPVCLLALAVLPNHAFSQDRYKDWRPVTMSDWNVQVNEALGINHAVIIYDGAIIDDRKQEKGVSYRSWYRRVRVFDEKGMEAFRTVEIPFPKGAKIKKLKARTLKADGREIPIDKKDVYEKTILSFGSLRREAKVFAFKGVEPGDILEYYCVAEWESSAPPMVELRHRFYTLESEVFWYYKPIRRGTPAWTITNARKFANTVEELPEKRPNRLHVRFQNLPSLPDEEYMPPDEEIATLFLGSYRFPKWEQKVPFWQRVSEWCGEETREFLKKDSRLDSWAEERLRADRDLDEDLENCLDWIQEEIRNVDWMKERERPEKVKDCKNVNALVENGIGTSVEITQLAAAMLKRLGYEATVFWNRDQSFGTFLPRWHTASQFTMVGVVVKEEGDLRWCFPGYPYLTPAAIPWRAAGTRALLEDLSTEDDENPFPTFADIPMGSPEENRISLKASLHVDDLLKARGRLEVIWRCRSDIDLHLDIEDEAEEDACEYLRARALWSGVNWTAHDETFTDDGRTVTYRCSLEVENLVEDAGRRKVIDLGAMRIDSFRFSERPRECQIRFRYPAIYSTRVELAIPDGYIVAAVPAYRELKESILDYRSMWTIEEQKAVRHRRLRLPHCAFYPRAAVAVRELFETVYVADQEPIVIKEDVSGE